MMSLFTNPIILGLIAACILAFAYYFIIYIKPVKRVLLLRPRDHRGKSLQTIQETDLGIVCRAVKGVTHRFIKVGPSWVFHEGGRMVTKFFGIEGTAYSGVVKGDDFAKVSVREYLVFLWGEVFYNGIPKVQRDKVEDDVMGITIAVDKIDEEEAGLPTLTASDINDENDNIVLSKIAEPQKGKTSDTVIRTLTNFILGAAVTYFIIKQGYI